MSRVLLEEWRKREHLCPGLLVAHFSAGGELREEQGSTGTMNFGTGSVCRSDVTFPGCFFAGFGVSQMKMGEKPQFWVLRGLEIKIGKEARFWRLG